MSKSPINDGYTIKATIPAIGPWPEVVFRYRPLLAAEVCEFSDNQTSKKGAQRLGAIIRMLAKQLVDWSVQKPNSSSDDDREPISESSLARMPMVHINHMIDAVMSYSSLEQEIDEKN